MKYLISIGGAFVIVFPIFVGAEIYEPLTDFTGFQEAGRVAQSGDFSQFINLLYRMSIGIASLLAVFMIVWAGFQYAISAAAGTKEAMRERITMALGGLLLLLGAYLLLDMINPNLNNLQAVDRNTLSFRGVTGSTVNDAWISDNVTAESGRSTGSYLNDFDGMTIEEYQRIFGVPPTHVGANGLVVLTATDLRRLLDRYNDGGISPNDGVTPGVAVEDIGVNITENAQLAVAAAIRLHNLQNPGFIPESWANEAGLYKIIAKESAGIVGRPNYALAGYINSRGISQNQLAGHVRSNVFYSRHCCRLKTSSNAELRNRVLSEPEGATCSPDSQSRLMDYTRAQAQAGVNGYSHISGACASAAGIGQLLVANMQTYQPGGVSGYGTASEEIYGMLSYIKERYGNPAAAWARYKTGIGY